MIAYKRDGFAHLFNLFKLPGSMFPFVFAIAMPNAVITGIITYSEVIGHEEVLVDSAVWSGFSFLVGFLVVFRTSQAYSRFWDGATAMHRMRAEWLDAATSMIAFCAHTDGKEEAIHKFRQTLVRLFSLMHAMALGNIEEMCDGSDLEAFNLELVDPSGIDRVSWKTLTACTKKANLVFTWIQVLIVDAMKSGIITVPAPILSRVFQELANGMVCLHDAQKIAEIPFPFPYAQACDLVLVLHWILMPFIATQWTSSIPWACGFSFIQVFSFWALCGIATEIEHPFGRGSNDLDPEDIQAALNEDLLLLLHPAAMRAPSLSRQAMNNLGDLGRSSFKEEEEIQRFTVFSMRGDSAGSSSPDTKDADDGSREPSTYSSNSGLEDVGRLEAPETIAQDGELISDNCSKCSSAPTHEAKKIERRPGRATTAKMRLKYLDLFSPEEKERRSTRSRNSKKSVTLNLARSSIISPSPTGHDTVDPNTVAEDPVDPNTVAEDRGSENDDLQFRLGRAHIHTGQKKAEYGEGGLGHAGVQRDPTAVGRDASDAGAENLAVVGL